MREIVKIVPSELKQKVELGWKLDQLAQHYGLSKGSMRNALKQLGLKIRSTRTPAFTFVEEEVHAIPAKHITPEDIVELLSNHEENKTSHDIPSIENATSSETESW